MLDKNFNLFLIEVNQHPNLYPSGDHANNRHLYDNLLFNLFNLIGVGTSYRKTDLRIPNYDYELMEVHPSSIAVRPEVCTSKKCQNSCFEPCELCMKCLKNSSKYDFIQAYREQLNAGNFQRLFPPPAKNLPLDAASLSKLSIESRLHVEWFSEMCKKNPKFCWIKLPSQNQ